MSARHNPDERVQPSAPGQMAVALIHLAAHQQRYPTGKLAGVRETLLNEAHEDTALPR